MGGTLPLEELKNILFSCNIQAGASSHWSEIAQITTLDRLLTAGVITFSQYLERLPDGYIAKREELLEETREMEANIDFPANA